MAKNNKDRFLPLELINEVSSKFPNCWDEIEKIVDIKRNKEMNWHDKVYVPMAGIGTIMTEIYTKNYKRISEHSKYMSLLSCLCSWRIHKQVYSFPAEMEKMLYDQAADFVNEKMPVEVLYNLPYDCVYIETICLSDDSETGIDGIFVFFDEDIRKSRIKYKMELRLLLILKNSETISLYIPLIEGKTLYECIEIAERQAFDDLENVPDGFWHTMI